MKSKVISIIMGGGRGTRLHPLTAERCKPAVPLAGKFRLADIPISNCLHSGLNQIYVLTQFNTASLHRHIQETYRFDPFAGGFVDILSAEQTQKGSSWYQGTADAVRQNLHHLSASDDDLVLILSGDQLYQMDFQQLIRQHRNSGAQLTLAGKAMKSSEVSGLGLMRVEGDLSVTEFVEKPTDPDIINGLMVGDEIASILNASEDESYVLANMGIYLFNFKTLKDAVDNNFTDFGKEVIPQLLSKVKMQAYLFAGYWEDIGTVRSFFDANLSLTDIIPPFNFFDEEKLVYTRARYLPASKINGSSFSQAVMADGCIITDARFERCVLGVRSCVGKGSSLMSVVMMGADFCESVAARSENIIMQRPDVGIGEHCHIENAIIDKNARIGDHVHLSPEGKPDLFTMGDVTVRDGVLIVKKNGTIPDGTVI